MAKWLTANCSTTELLETIGITGFEPMHSRIKNERLTTWLYSSIDWR